MYSKECAELIRHLENGISVTAELEALLLQEQAALINHRVDDLEALIELKQASLDRAEEFQLEFSAMLLKSGRRDGDGREPIEVELCPESNIGVEKTRRLEGLLLRCQTLSAENEGLVNQAMNHVNHSIQILQGSPAGAEVVLYGPEGNNNPAEKQSRTLGYI